MKNILLPVFLLTAAALAAQNVTVMVSDRDLEIPLEGAMLTLAGTETPYFAGPDGTAVVALPETMRRFVLLISYPGYQQVRLPFNPDDGDLTVEMVLSDMIEGEELVVERQRRGKSDEKIGESVVLDEREMETTANIGIVEDVMSSIKTLPGVGYTGSFNAQPAIRGGYPGEMAAALDGFYVTYPFHWGGAYSIFNPNMVESAKLSHGVYSARYGRALSGLLEITTKTPDEPEIRTDGSLSTTSVDAFVQTPLPLGIESGLFAGGKITYLDSMRLIAPDATKDMTTIPYIRDFYVKMFTRPNTAMEFSLNGFVGTDGVGVESDSLGRNSAEGVTNELDFSYDYTNGFAAAGMKWTPSDSLHFDVLAGYNYNYLDFSFRQSANGSRTYSDEFITEFGSSYGLNPGDTFSYDNLTSQAAQYTLQQQGQVKFTAEKLLNQSQIISAGTELIYYHSTFDASLQGWEETFTGGQPELRYTDIQYDTENNSSVNPVLFLIWEYGNESSRLSAEAGLRAEHYYMWNNGFSLNGRPVLNPRLSLRWKLLEDQNGFDNVTLSAGTGLFSNMAARSALLTEDYGVKDWTFSPDQALFSLAGAELQWDQTWKATFETYYRYYLSRLVISQNTPDPSGTTDFGFGTDNNGHSAGFDILLQKKISRKWDGYLSYSFNWSRFYNHSNFDGADTEQGGILDQWYYPYFHRWHNMSVVFNWRFRPGWTFSVTGSLASGAPKSETGDIAAYPALVDTNKNGTWDPGEEVLERYIRTEEYSDTLRNGVSVPVNLRIAYGNYYKNSKVRWEFYFALEDVFVNIYQPETNSSLNPVTGEESRDTSADFNIGAPVPSVGFKLSY